MQQPDSPSTVRDALDSAITRFERTSATTFEGDVLPGAPLVGPKGRVHGGLHPMVRVFLPLSRLGVPSTVPLHAELPLRASLPIGEVTPFIGELDERGDDFVLRTRFGLEGRLDAEARSRPAEPSIAAFADELRACRALPEVKTILARGSVPTRIGRQTISMTMDETFYAARDNEMNAYRMRDGGFDEAFACVALDLVGAVTLGFLHTTHVYTVHLSLDFHRRSMPRDTTLVAIASIARATPDTQSGVKPVEVRDVLVPPTRVPVLLADAELRTPFVTGYVTVVPVRNSLATPR